MSLMFGGLWLLCGWRGLAVLAVRTLMCRAAGQRLAFRSTCCSAAWKPLRPAEVTWRAALSAEEQEVETHAVRRINRMPTRTGERLVVRVRCPWRCLRPSSEVAGGAARSATRRLPTRWVHVSRAPARGGAVTACGQSGVRDGR